VCGRWTWHIRISQPCSHLSGIKQENRNTKRTKGIKNKKKIKQKKAKRKRGFDLLFIYGISVFAVTVLMISESL
jgi:hypothetical protein